ncbi:hypothetical protein PV729_04330 [Streptomyces europaeiscabiei]|uniref:Transposase n=1 Tax=Streptomyces europaeiscabiei TaxID=146819 RepID=A0ABU4NAF3_9ACTN|nr:hypothetical protein [Streptomyces europaeiscabiei]MDX3551005.1 hypothetical protein [Streptomyces europaeiscabiei]MDX3698435.1 hypothetical protein [Streptomyces europaeiscabiei]
MAKSLHPRALEAVAEILRGSADEEVSRPLWSFLPEEAPIVLSERRRRNILQGDPEPIGDPEYS